MGDWSLHILLKSGITDVSRIKWRSNPYFTGTTPKLIQKELYSKVTPTQDELTRLVEDSDLIEFIDFDSKLILYKGYRTDYGINVSQGILREAFLGHYWSKWKIYRSPISLSKVGLKGLEFERHSIKANSWSAWRKDTPEINIGPSLRDAGAVKEENFKHGILMVRIKPKPQQLQSFAIESAFIESILFPRKPVIDEFFSLSGLKSAKIYEQESDYFQNLTSHVEAIIEIDVANKTLSIGSIPPSFHFAHIERFWNGWKVVFRELREFGRSIGFSKGPFANSEDFDFETSLKWTNEKFPEFRDIALKFLESS